VNSNGIYGIFCSGSSCLVSGNTINNNSGVGIYAADSTSGYAGNVLYDDDGTTKAGGGCVIGGVSLGNNLCNGEIE
jgi:parallel beta-helix repeat protein